VTKRIQINKSGFLFDLHYCETYVTGGRGRRIMFQGQPWQKCNTLSEKKRKRKTNKQQKP
jgi:hypothetical protein